MSVKSEQYNSLIKTRRFLVDLLDSKERPKTVSEMKKRSLECLRHFPFLKEDGEPMFSNN
jgi:hypothetical protein